MKWSFEPYRIDLNQDFNGFSLWIVGSDTGKFSVYIDSAFYRSYKYNPDSGSFVLIQLKPPNFRSPPIDRVSIAESILFFQLEYAAWLIERGHVKTNAVIIPDSYI